MANRQRHLKEHAKARRYPAASDVKFNIGDLVYLDTTATDTLRSASETPYTTTAAAQQAFATAFKGVARQDVILSTATSPAVDYRHIDPTMIGTAGVYEFECDAATFKIGDLVGVAPNSNPDGLENQKVVAVANSNLAIGKVALTESSNVTKVQVEIFTKDSAAIAGTASNEVAIPHTVTAGEFGAGQVDLDPGFGTDPSFISLTVLTVTTGETKSGLNVTFPGSGIVRIANNTASLATGDKIYLLSRQ